MCACVYCCQCQKLYPGVLWRLFRTRNECAICYFTHCLGICVHFAAGTARWCEDCFSETPPLLLPRRTGPFTCSGSDEHAGNLKENDVLPKHERSVLAKRSVWKHLLIRTTASLKLPFTEIAELRRLMRRTWQWVTKTMGP